MQTSERGRRRLDDSLHPRIEGVSLHLRHVMRKHVRRSAHQLLLAIVLTAAGTGYFVVSAAAGSRPPGCAAFPNVPCSSRTAVAIFGQLSSSDPGFTGRAKDYSRPRSFRITAQALNIVRIHFYGLSWRHWGSLRAVARGTATTCTTTSTSTHCATRRVRSVADQFAPCGDVNLYQRLRAYGVAGFPSPLNILVADQNCGVARVARSVPLIQDVSGAHYKPASFCPANHTCFSHAHWKRWGHIAVGRGTAHFETPTGGSRTFRTKITLSRVRKLCGELRYTRAVWSGWQTFFIPVGSCGIWTGG
jgi:hypothetical protein